MKNFWFSLNVVPALKVWGWGRLKNQEENKSTCILIVQNVMCPSHVICTAKQA